MPRVTRLVALALALLAALPGASTAAPEAGVRHVVVDGTMVIGYDDPVRPTVGFVATLARHTDDKGDVLYLCVSYGTRTRNENGCATLAPRAVTKGDLLPESATVRGRVPVRGRRGGWMEVDLAVTAVGDPALPPAEAGHLLHDDGATVGAGVEVIRTAAYTGTFRADRVARFSPAPHPDALIRPMLFRSTHVYTKARTGLDAVSEAFARAAADLLP